jgi:16S rRNA (cytosine967-C5)-methyltransferase
VALQKDLLTRALDLCAPGGYVAYVTCSPVVAETTEVVDAVLVARHDAILVDTPSVLDRVARRPVMGARRGSAVQLWSVTHGTDAMFVQLIQRVSSVG